MSVEEVAEKEMSTDRGNEKWFPGMLSKALKSW
jgi:hypothetical protein